MDTPMERLWWLIRRMLRRVLLRASNGSTCNHRARSLLWLTAHSVLMNMLNLLGVKVGRFPNCGVL